MARFEAVNGSIAAAAAATATSSPSALGQSRQKSRRLGVLDMHFQSTRTFGPVLDALLWPEVQAVWAEHERSGKRKKRHGLLYSGRGIHIFFVTIMVPYVVAAFLSHAFDRRRRVHRCGPRQHFTRQRE